MNGLGLLFAVGAMLFWTIGDFSIQKGTRAFGNFATLFIIGIVGAVLIFPFVYKELPMLARSDLLASLMLLNVVTLFAALFLFEALKRGKLAVIEPVFGVELPFTVAFSIVLGGENLPAPIYALITLVFIGLLLTVTADLEYLRFRKTLLEKGVVLAAVGSIAMGLMNYLTGLNSQASSPLLTMWFLNVFLAIVAGAYLLSKGEFRSFLTSMRREKLVTFGVGFVDNAAWVSYAYSMVLLPISIATAISESYIALTVLLGVFLNKEKLRSHQAIGVVLAVGAVIALAYLAP